MQLAEPQQLNSEPTPLSCRQHFPALSKTDVHGIRVFADNSSRAQMPAESLTAVQEQLNSWETHRGGLPEYDSHRSAKAAGLREKARRVAAQFCSGEAAQIGFAANGTSTLAILAKALFGTVLQPGDNIVITEVDHDANRTIWQSLSDLGCNIIDIEVAADGGLEITQWYAALAKRPKLVAFCMLSNVTGVLLPYEKLANEAKAMGSVVVLDAVQGPPHGFTNIMLPSIDIAIFSNCKLFSPHLGWWCIRQQLVEQMGLSPAKGCHPQLELGSFAHADYAGFIATFNYLSQLTGNFDTSMEQIRQHEGLLTRRFLEGLPDRLKGLVLAYHTPYSRAPIFSLAIPPEKWSSCKQLFTDAGIDVRIGRFGTPATLKRLAHHTNNAALRISFVHYNTLDDVDAVLAVLARL